MDPPNSGLHHEVTNSGRKRCDPGGLQQAVQNDTLCGNNGRNISGEAGKVVQGQHVEAAQATRKCGVRQRTLVCGRTDQRIKLNAGNRNKIVNSVPPTDRWANRTNEPRVGAILKVLCRS